MPDPKPVKRKVHNRPPRISEAIIFDVVDSMVPYLVRKYRELYRARASGPQGEEGAEEKDG